MILIQSGGQLILDGRDTKLSVTQTGEGTLVFTPETFETRYRVHEMPHSRYSLANDKPASGAAGRQQFEEDLTALLRALHAKAAWWEPAHPLKVSP